MEYEIPKLIIVVVVVVVVVVVCGKSRLTNEMEYAIMCMVVDTVYCVSFMYLSYMPFTALVACFYVLIRGLYIYLSKRAVWGLE